ncbi:hypothetical protein RSJ21_15600 [Clostridium botulinum]|uniref:DUF503 domain-containing protein n=1 Tax=Clostridium botulinum (strain Hall / ATCC 3502 / NCTC 13319 / Type A) TaxID=441771 RepID=A5I5Z7_CLOBH|nr:DUF503 domain-containing protein [Clostridium botulinum]EPS47870.1 hypothetical protein CFSAN002369_19623 [Clostridium botulinum CFSAN002369]ABS33305.1 conserved hypothetical protein [Clostridium botulinum A str. ATCC 19397]ABS36833.1 conserved hypothetical protein [Clostridium botulinum A str. Hall]APQ72225.1 hypothetical protein RSJ9_3318 [Clostridium botulinum]AUM88890.1 hypothetical protein RSJ15_14710 [Clostridium botulinum]
MIIGTAKIHLYANWVHSLKEKRMIAKSVISKTKNKFNVSIAEVEMQDVHQSIIIGIACVSNSTKQADSIIQNVVNYIEGNTEAIVQNIETEII